MKADTETLDALFREIDQVGGTTLIYGEGAWFGGRLDEDLWVERAKRHYVTGVHSLHEFEHRIDMILQHFRGR